MAIVGLIVCVQLHGGARRERGREGGGEREREWGRGREGGRRGEGEREGGQRGRLTDARLGILPSTERETRLCPTPFRQAPDPYTHTHTHTQSHARTHARLCRADVCSGIYGEVSTCFYVLLAPKTVYKLRSGAFRLSDVVISTSLIYLLSQQIPLCYHYT